METKCHAKKRKKKSHVANFLVKIEAYSKTNFIFYKLKDFSSEKLYEHLLNFVKK